MKTIKIFLLIAFTTLFLGSCDFDDEYSLSDTWVGFGLTDNVSGGYGHSFIIRMDDGSVLYPIDNQVPWFDIEKDQRLLVNYTIVGDKNISGNNKEYYVRINQLKEILYKGILKLPPQPKTALATTRFMWKMPGWSTVC